MELYLSDHPHEESGCRPNGGCELHDLADSVGLTDVRYGFSGSNHQSATTDASNPYFAFDPTTCIVCSRCVRACDEIQGTLALTVEGRGFESVISAGGLPFMESECVSCGACVTACPTSGKPYKDRPRMYLDQAEFDAESSNAFTNSSLEMGG